MDNPENTAKATENDTAKAVENALENPPGKPCYYCGEWHDNKLCPRVKSLSYDVSTGKVSRTEFFAPWEYYPPK